MGNVLEIKNVCKTYTSKKGIVYANKDISFDLSENEILAVLGPNGAGKSTLIKQIIGYTIYDSGSIKIKGIEVNKSKDNLLAEIGYMMQSRFEHWDHLSIYDAVYYSARLRKVAKDQAKKEIEYLAKELDFINELNKPIRYLSGGKKQAAALACAVVGNPAILILDEPTTGLDPEKKYMFWKFLKKLQKYYGTSILLITHNVAEVEEIVDRVILLGEGRVIDEGTPDSLYKKVKDEVRIEIELKKELEKQEEENLFGQYNYKNNGLNVYIYTSEIELINCVTYIFNCKSLSEYMKNFKIIRPSLEDVYIKIMGEKIF